MDILHNIIEKLGQSLILSINHNSVKDAENMVSYLKQTRERINEKFNWNDWQDNSNYYTWDEYKLLMDKLYYTLLTVRYKCDNIDLKLKRQINDLMTDCLITGL